MNGFRLISIELKESDEFDAGVYQFSSLDFKKENQQPYTSLVIGPNGTGKSRLLKIVLDIFNDLYNYINLGKADYRFNEYYRLKYVLNNDIYEIENSRQQQVSKNGTPLRDIFEIKLPQKAIAAAYSLYEKFTPKTPIKYSEFDTRRRTRYDNDFYEYLGVKSERNFTFSGAYIAKSIDLITEALANDGFSKDVKHVFGILGFLPRIELHYKIRNRELLEGNLTVEQFKNSLEINRYSGSGFITSTFERLKSSPDEYISEIVKALNETSKFTLPDYSVIVDLIFEENVSQASFRRRYKYISLLRSLNLLTAKNVFVYKKVRKNPDGAPIDLKNMSSGEIQILTSMLALSSIVKENSLVLIDEPEISLHPNWQIRFINILNTVFRNFRDCHFIIASHSHFLVSDLKENSSAILSLKKNKKLETVPEFIDYDTEGWSAENILYNVFDVATVRNHYFEMDLRELLKLISGKSKSTSKVKTLIKKFERFNIHPNDPLNVILKQAKKYVNED